MRYSAPCTIAMPNHSHGSTDLVALTVLALLSEEPCHPYQMQRVIRERHLDFARGKPRGFYHAVNRLLGDGLIEPVETSREGRRPERTVYRVTERGLDELQAWLADLIAVPGEDESPFTVAVGFLGYLAEAAILPALTSRSIALQSGLASLDAVTGALAEQLHLPRMVFLGYECMRARMAGELGWVQSLIADIRAGRLTFGPENFEAHQRLEHGSNPGSKEN